ncbi:MAG: DUF982 domain-containing protein [Rhizobiaceae bacterium]
MDDKPFQSPVTLEFGRSGATRRIASAREAAECLMTIWPLQRGPRHRDAVETCLKVLDGHRSSSEARRALIEAAEESRIPVSTRH